MKADRKGALNVVQCVCELRRAGRCQAGVRTASSKDSVATSSAPVTPSAQPHSRPASQGRHCNFNVTSTLSSLRSHPACPPIVPSRACSLGCHSASGILFRFASSAPRWVAVTMAISLAMRAQRAGPAAVLRALRTVSLRFASGTSGVHQDVGFIGLGNMGSHMAANLLTAGHHLTVHDRSVLFPSPKFAV